MKAIDIVKNLKEGWEKDFCPKLKYNPDLLNYSCGVCIDKTQAEFFGLMFPIFRECNEPCTVEDFKECPYAKSPAPLGIKSSN